MQKMAFIQEIKTKKLYGQTLPRRIQMSAPFHKISLRISIMHPEALAIYFDKTYYLVHLLSSSMI